MSYEVRWDKKQNKYIKVIKKQKIDELKGTEDEKELNEDILKLYIKNEYFRINDFDEKVLRKELPLSRKDRDVSVDVYITFLEGYLNRLKNGRRPDKSILLSAPDSFGKKTFAYQVIKECLRHDLKPTEILSSHDLYSQLDKKEYVDFYQNFDGVDVGIVTLGGAPSNTDLIVMKTVLEYCEREGFPVLILSRFDPSMFHKIDVMASLYLGVKASRRGDFGKAELQGFDKEKMTLIREEISGGVSTGTQSEEVSGNSGQRRRRV